MTWEDSGLGFVANDHRITGAEKLSEPQPVAPLPRRVAKSGDDVHPIEACYYPQGAD